ncbi:MAG: hypothetical protein ACFFCI_17165 [Promethearchaeota archaeon]
MSNYIAVDPDTLDKGKPSEKFPISIILITITSIAGGLGIVGVSIVLLHRRKRKSTQF